MVLSMKKLGENQVASFLADQHGENCHKGSEVHKTTPNDYLSKDQKSKIGKGDAHASNVDVQKGRPMSPGTLALLCDEKDMLSTPDAPSDGSVNLQTVRENQTTSFLASRDGENCHKGSEVHKTTPNDCLRWDQESKNGKGDTHPGDADVQEGRPMSPRTLALLCDEKDMLFTPDASLDRTKSYISITNVYVEQERLVLMKFWDCLNGFIIRGNIKVHWQRLQYKLLLFSAWMATQEDHVDNNNNDSKIKQFRWTPAMDQLLIELLVEEVKKGHKVDKGFKKPSYVCAAKAVSQKFNVLCTFDKVENRMKTTKTKFNEVKKIRKNSSGFGWDDNKKMFTCPDSVYKEYIEALKTFQQLQILLKLLCRIQDPLNLKLGATGRELDLQMNFLKSWKC